MSQLPAPSIEEAPRRRAADAEARKRVAKHFLLRVKGGEKWPLEEWAEAWNTYEGKAIPSARPRANLWRVKIDTHQAFMVEEPPATTFTPQDGVAEDPIAIGRAKCEEGAYRYIFREQDYHTTVQKACLWDSVVSLGAVWHTIDRHSNLPTITWLDPSKELAIDGQCGGDIRRALWVAVAQYESAEMLATQQDFIRAGITLAKLKKAVEKTSQEPALDPDTEDVQRLAAAQEVADYDKKCIVWHFYARGHVALYDTEPANAEGVPAEGKPHLERFGDSLKMEEPRRYLLLVEGLEEPVIDEDAWPVALDTNEWPVTIINHAWSRRSIAGGTDLRHESRLIGDHEQSLADLHVRDTLRNPPKFAKAPSCKLTDDIVRRMLSSGNVEVFENALGDDGKPLISLIDWGTIRPEDLRRPDDLRALYDIVAMLPKVMRGEQFDEARTKYEVQTVVDAAMAGLERRLRLIERFYADIARKTMQIAHTIIPVTSTVEVPEEIRIGVPDPLTGEMVEVGTGQYEMVTLGASPMPPLPWAQAEVELRRPGARLLRLGIDAMVSPDLVQFWEPDMPLALLRRNVKVAVEHGSTQRQARLDKAKSFRELFGEVISPLIQQIAVVNPQAAVDLQVRIVERLLSVSDMTGFADIVAALKQATASAPMSVAPMAAQETPVATV